MQIIPSACPFCGGELTVTRLYCSTCESGIDGRFQGGPFAGLGPEQMAFVEAFVRSEGKFTRLEGELGLSYPTLRARLNEVMRALGVEPGEDDAALDATERKRVLDDLEAGRLDADEALRLLRGGKA